MFDIYEEIWEREILRLKKDSVDRVKITRSNFYACNDFVYTKENQCNKHRYDWECNNLNNEQDFRKIHMEMEKLLSV